MASRSKVSRPRSSSTKTQNRAQDAAETRRFVTVVAIATVLLMALMYLILSSPE